jgi:hypothetical protein
MCSLSEIITVMSGDSVHVRKDLFSHKKAYLLVGGLGSLGIQIAQWMYKVRMFLFASTILSRPIRMGLGKSFLLRGLGAPEFSVGETLHLSASSNISRACLI